MKHPSLNSTHQFKLLDGIFSGEEAATVLLSLVKSKIDFHAKEKLSSEERFGSDLSGSESRVAELLQVHECLRALCKHAENDGIRLRVAGWLEIDLVSPLEGPSAEFNAKAFEADKMASV